MSTAEGATLGLLVLAAGGALPALALARARLVVIPLIPLTGAVLAGLSVTAMVGVGGTVGMWFAILSTLGAVGAVLWWWRRPDAVPWRRNGARSSAGMVLAAAGVGCVALAVGLSSLKAPMTAQDADAIWLLHPVWYLAGHARSVAILRSPAFTSSHPPYPPLVGGSIAMAWLVSGSESYRLGVVMVALLNGLAIFAAASAMVELADRLIIPDDGRRRRAMIRGGGIVMSVVLILVAFSVGGAHVSDGLADVLWAAAAAGAVAYGLVLPCVWGNTGAALVLASVAGTTKLEGAITAAVIVGLVAARVVLSAPSAERRRLGPRVGALAAATLAVIGIWPLVTHLLGAVADVPNIGIRTSPDITRLHATLSAAWAALHILPVAIAIALVGAFTLGSARRRAGLGGDGWAWAAVVVGLAVVIGAYVFGPGDVFGWLGTSADRTMTFPLLGLWWLVATWVLLAVAEVGREEGPDAPHVTAAEARTLEDDSRFRRVLSRP